MYVGRVCNHLCVHVWMGGVSIGGGFLWIWLSKHSGKSWMACVCVGGGVGTGRDGINGK